MKRKVKGCPVLTMGEVQQIFPASRPTISKWVKQGALPSIKVGSKWYVLRLALEKMLSDGTTEKKNDAA